MAKQKKQQYFNIEISATNRNTKLWLGDLNGFLVKMAVGRLSIGLLPGDYVVQMELNGPTYPIHLGSNLKVTQMDLEAGSPCARPVFRMLPEIKHDAQ